ncbi:hypothetical protein ACFQZ4_52590 [Catellatospora coxensis]|nr:hypothetical protein [Catellatospora coxensis]
MDAILGSIVGGILAIAGGLFVSIASDRKERVKWQRDAQIKASAELVSALQVVIRRLREIAFMGDKTSKEAETALSLYHDATSMWNSAMYSVILVSSPRLTDLVLSLDREVDRLCARAREQEWSRADFRRERLTIGRLSAQYLDAARGVAGLPKLQLNSAWSWEMTTAEEVEPIDAE